MATIQLPPDFKEFLRLLNSHEVEYLLIGGYAVNYYGYARATAGMDFWIGIDASNAAKVASVLREFGFSQAAADLFAEPGKVVRMGVPPMRIGVFTSVSGLEFPTAFRNRVIAEIDGVPVYLISLPDLKTNKKACGRYRDLADLEQLD
jgi:predicted nucleotidyltransferase